MKFFLNSLPVQQQKLWPLLSDVSNLKFVLYGGTSLALRFNHRESVDFDFFSSCKFTEMQLIKIFPWLINCDNIQNETNAYSYRTEYGAKITFLGGFNCGRIGIPAIEPSTGIQIASPEDVFCLKIGAVHGRKSKKDFLDIAELIKHGYSLKKAIAGSDVLIKNMLPPRISIKALTWYNEPELADLPDYCKKIIIDECIKLNLNELENESVTKVSEFLYDDNLKK